MYSLVVGLAVVYLGEHWVVDVLAGYAFAGLAAWLCVSPRVRRMYSGIPGDPVRRLSQLNDRICGPIAPPEAEPTAHPEPETLPRAA